MKKLLVLLLCLCMLLPCAMGEQTHQDQVYTDEQGNWIRIYYDEELGSWCQFTRYAHPNEEGYYVCERKQQDGTLLHVDWVYTVDNEEVDYRDFNYLDGVLTDVITYHENGDLQLDSYDPSGLMLHSEINYAQLNEDGYSVSKRFRPDGTINHEWWWNEDGLYYEVWYNENQQIEIYTYHYYNTTEADEIYEEYTGDGTLQARWLYNYNESGERVRIDE